MISSCFSSLILLPKARVNAALTNSPMRLLMTETTAQISVSLSVASTVQGTQHLIYNSQQT